jgi:putative hydrolase of the HAD superfamily
MLTKKYACIDAFDVSMFSYEVGMAKPDPSIYYLILNRLHVAPSEAIFVDDFSANIQAASEVGIHAVHFLNREQAIAEIRGLLQG